MYIYIFFALTYLVDFYDKNRLLNQQINEAHVASQEELQNALKDATEHSLAEAKLKSENTVLKNCTFFNPLFCFFNPQHHHRLCNKFLHNICFHLLLFTPICSYSVAAFE